MSKVKKSKMSPRQRAIKGSFKCKICGKVFTGLTAISGHYKKHRIG